MPIIRRKYHTYATPGIGHSEKSDNTCFRVTNTRCRLHRVFSPDDGHIVPRSKYRKAINISRKFVHQVGSISKITRHIHGVCFIVF